MEHRASDEQLMLDYAGGDAGAFEVLYRRHKGAVYRYMLRQCGNEAVAEELFQDVWLNLIRARESYTVRARFTTYLFRLAHNRLVDHYRRQAGRLPVSYHADCSPDPDELAAGPETQPEQRIARQQQADRLKDLIQILPEAQREAFLLRQEGGLSVEEIAQITNVGMETAKSRLRYAVARLKSGLQEIK